MLLLFGSQKLFKTKPFSGVRPGSGFCFGGVNNAGELSPGASTRGTNTYIIAL